jgi:hypothetical protein
VSTIASPVTQVQLTAVKYAVSGPRLMPFEEAAGRVSKVPPMNITRKNPMTNICAALKLIAAFPSSEFLLNKRNK